MQTKEYRTVDKSDWIDGEWKNEPDKVQWQDEATGLPCLIVRGPSGALCGYVGVSESHPLYKKDYEHADVEVHGGLTFADMCADAADESRHICHVPDLGEPDHVWWFGFDCAHSGDVCPKYAKEHGTFPLSALESYRSLGYVRSEVRGLAWQLAALAA
jgi:hypothetical protein